jgi:hypothetical protein
VRERTYKKHGRPAGEAQDELVVKKK